MDPQFQAVEQGPLRSAQVQNEYSHLSPGGAEVRPLLKSQTGGMTHIVIPPGHVSTGGKLKGLDDVFYVVSGKGSLWRDGPNGGSVVALTPGVAVPIPPDTSFQYRADEGAPLTLVESVMPKWERHLRLDADRLKWEPSAKHAPSPSTGAPKPPALGPSPEVLAKTVRSNDHVLAKVRNGQASIRTLEPGKTLSGNQPSNKNQICYVLEGSGAVRRTAAGGKSGSQEMPLVAGRCFDLPPGAEFLVQAAAGSRLRLFVLSLPADA